jgi:flavin-dependent dehydrogenase
MLAGAHDAHPDASMTAVPPSTTLTLIDAAVRDWPVLVIGAGPAGAGVALALARAGVEVLLVDKARFPRFKACGCCLNGAALGALCELDAHDLPRSLGAHPLRALELRTGSGSATIRLPGGGALSRTALDAALIARAIDSGVQFLSQTTGHLDPDCHDQIRRISLRRKNERTMIRARLVIAADGLAGSALRDLQAVEARVRRRSRMGAAVILDQSPDFVHPGVICMFVGRGGYVGMVRLEDDRLNIAGALDPAFVKASGGPGGAARAIMRESGFDGPSDLTDADWRGTGLLTRRRRSVADRRLLILGDAAGYVEPFTGEGIAWALESALAAAPFAADAVKSPHAWRPEIADAWTRCYHRLVRRRQFTCRLIARGLRSPRLTRAVVALLSHQPALAAPIVRAMQRSHVTPAAAMARVVP